MSFQSRFRHAALVAAMALAAPGGADAQVRPAARFRGWEPTAVEAGIASGAIAIAVDTAASADELSLALGGVLAFFPGVLVGGAVGAALENADGCDGEWCGLGGALVGASAGTAVSIAMGVHLTNRRRGRLDRAILATTGVAAAGWVLALAFDDARPILMIPFGQLVAAIAVERATTPRAAGAP